MNKADLNTILHDLIDCDESKLTLEVYVRYLRTELINVIDAILDESEDNNAHKNAG